MNCVIVESSRYAESAGTIFGSVLYLQTHKTNTENDVSTANEKTQSKSSYNVFAKKIDFMCLVRTIVPKRLVIELRYKYEMAYNTLICKH